MENAPLKTDEIKARLLDAGYPHPKSSPPSGQIREISRQAQEARVKLREHIIDDIWALLDEVESLRARTKP